VIDTIRAGTAPAVIVRKGAEGSLTVPLEEKIEILIHLSADADETLRNKAFRTLQNWNPQELQQLLADAATPWNVLDYLANHIVPGRQDLIEALLKNPGVPPDLIDWVKSAPARTSPLPPPPGAAAEVSAEDAKDDKRQTLLQRINAMTPAEKIKAALTGNQEERLVLIRDSNKLVARAVLQSPKLTDAEIEAYAAMKNVTEEVLRLISMNRAFMKSYSVARTLANNPRTPLDVALPLIVRLNDRDLKGLSLNKNVAETLRTMALKLIKQKLEAKKSKIPTGKQ